MPSGSTSSNRLVADRFFTDDPQRNLHRAAATLPTFYVKKNSLGVGRSTLNPNTVVLSPWIIPLSTPTLASNWFYLTTSDDLFIHGRSLVIDISSGKPSVFLDWSKK
jgi:hypothetical protein